MKSSTFEPGLSYNLSLVNNNYRLGKKLKRGISIPRRRTTEMKIKNGRDQKFSTIDTQKGTEDSLTPTF